MSAEKILLGSIIDIKKGDYITKKEAKKGPYPVILGGQEPAYYIDKYNHTGQAIVISRSGASAGYVSCWNEPIFVTDGFLIEPKENINPVFLYYLLKHHQPHFQGLQGGAAIPHVNPRIINAVEVICPKTDVQLRIADILSAYDNLIENNQRQIKLLEEAAQRLYKEWFVDLRFPGHEHTAIVDGVPEGWRKTAISELGEYINGFAFKPSDWTTNGKPIIKIKEMGSGIVQNTPRNNGARVPEKYLVKSGDILFSWSATLMVMIWDNEDGWLNQHIFKVIPSSDVCREFLFQSISKAIHEFSNLTTGATMKHIQRNKLDNVFVSVPNKSIMDMFNNFSFPIRERILRLSEQTNLLKQARDRLLPKLMSGEMEV